MRDITYVNGVFLHYCKFLYVLNIKENNLKSMSVIFKTTFQQQNS